MNPWKRDYEPDPDAPGDDTRPRREEGTPWLELRAARLVVVGDELIRRDSKGGVALRLRLDDIEEVIAYPGLDPFGAVFIALALGIAAIGCFASESNVLTTILYVVAGLMLVLGIVGAVRHVLKLRVDGQTVPIYPTVVSFADGPEDVLGFAASLRAELNRRRRAAGPV